MLTLVPVSPFQVQDSKIAFLYHRPYREYLDVGHPKIHHEHSKHLRFVLDVHQKSFAQSEQRLEYYYMNAVVSISKYRLYGTHKNR